MTRRVIPPNLDLDWVRQVADPDRRHLGNPTDATVARSAARPGGPHGLRHTYATLSLEAGVDISVVSKQLGHSSVAFTARIYAHVTERLRLAAAGKLRAYVAERDAGQPKTETLTARERSVSDSDSATVP